MAIAKEDRQERRPHGAATVLATAAGNAYLVLGTLLWSLVALLAYLLPPRGRWVLAVGRLWARGWLAASGVKVRVEGPGPAPAAGRPIVYMANHQSAYDIPVLLTTLPAGTPLLAKQSLFRIPLFGWAMRAGGFIAIDRGDGGRVREGFEAALERIERGGSVLVFPEGTRSLDGRLGPMRRGGFLLAIKGGLAIVPIGIEGTLAVQRRGSPLVRPGSVTVRYGAPIDAADYGVRHRGALEAAVASELARLARCPAPETPPSVR